MNWQSILELEWSQPGLLRRSYELRHGETVVGLLDFESAFGSRALAQVDEGKWTFKRSGFFATHVTARREGAEEVIALYEPSWGRSKGKLQLRSGEEFEFRASNFWNTAWTLSSSSGELLTLESHGVMHHGCAVKLTQAAQGHEDPGLLISLCWYILLLHMADSSAVVVAAT